MAVVYHWRHGWIPLDHAAALSKAKGNHKEAEKLATAAHSHDSGIKSRRDVAGAVLDLPNVPAGDKGHARDQIHAAAREHSATDLLPHKTYTKADLRFAGHTDTDIRNLYAFDRGQGAKGLNQSADYAAELRKRGYVLNPKTDKWSKAKH